MLGQSCPSSCPRRARIGNGIVSCLPSLCGRASAHSGAHAVVTGLLERGAAFCVGASLGKSDLVPPFTTVLPCVCCIALLPPCPPCHCPCSSCTAQHWLLLAGDGCAVEGGKNEAGFLAPKSNMGIAEATCGKKKQKMEPKSCSWGEWGAKCCRQPWSWTRTSCRTDAERVLTSECPLS